MGACVTRERETVRFIKAPPKIIKEVMLIPVPIMPVPVPDKPKEETSDRLKLA